MARIDFKMLHLNHGNDVVIIACGTMVYESLMAQELLEKKGISARVLNVHTIKPIDEDAIIDAAKKCKAIVTAEDHQVFGGLGSAVADVVVKNCPVPIEMVGVMDRFGESGKPSELLKYFHLKDVDIVDAVEKVLKRRK